MLKKSEDFIGAPTLKEILRENRIARASLGGNPHHSLELEAIIAERQFEAKAPKTKSSSNGFDSICVLAYAGCKGAKDEIKFDKYCLDNNCHACPDYNKK